MIFEYENLIAKKKKIEIRLNTDDISAIGFNEVKLNDAT